MDLVPLGQDRAQADLALIAVEMAAIAQAKPQGIDPLRRS